MNIIRKARGSEIPRQAQRVFVCGDARNTAERDAIVKDLLSRDAGMDCVVSWRKEPDGDIDETLLRNELHDTQALVLWVTNELLETIREKDFPIEYRIAKELRTPILPIAKYDVLFPEFTRLAGAIHGIATTDAEYRTKLKQQLENFLVSEEVIKQIQEKAFTASVFLSYRKIDINEARRFMKNLHDDKAFEAVSIWYDNFLTAGRVFNKEIEKSIQKSDVFALLVTPNLLEKNAEGKDNYVVSTEYPFAREKGKPIAPVEASPTNLVLFSELFKGAENPVLMDDRVALHTVFHNKLGDSACLVELGSERAYLLGMAYLKGFGVERDVDKTVRLLEIATADCSVSAWMATNQLAELYENSFGLVIGIDYNKALHWGMKSSVYCEQLFGHEHTHTAEAYCRVAHVFYRQGDYQNAIKWYKKSLVINEKVLGKEHPDTAVIYNDIAVVYKNQGHYMKSIEWNQKALAIRKSVLGEWHPETAETYNNIANVYIQQGDCSSALEWHKKALTINEMTLGKEHPTTANSYNNIAVVYTDQREYDKALEWCRRALVIREKVLGKNHPDTALTYGSIANIYNYQNEYLDALVWYKKDLAICEKLLGKEHPSTAMAYNNIAVVYSKQGEHSIALELYRKALAIREKVLGKEHQDTAMTYNNIAANHIDLGEFSEGLDWYQKALLAYEKSLGKEHRATIQVYFKIASIYFKQGHHQKSLGFLQEIMQIYENTLGHEHPDTVEACQNVASTYYHLGDHQNALKLFLRIYKIRCHTLGQRHPDAIFTLQNVRDIFIRGGGRIDDYFPWLNKQLADTDLT